jgi:hypothetical protein
VYQLDDQYKKDNKLMAIEKSMEMDKLALGVFYEDATKAAYHQEVPLLQNNTLVAQFPQTVSLQKTLNQYV